MNTFSLRIRPAAAPTTPFGLATPSGATTSPGAAKTAHPAVAWLLIEPNVDRWLDELATWGLPLEEWTLYVVPNGPRDLAPKGVLCVPPPARKVAPSQRATPLAIIGGRLYAPVEARFDPPVGDDELESQLVGRVALLLPPDELIAFESEDAITAASLLTAPPERASDWNRAETGEPPLPRLSRVEPLSPPTATSLLTEGGDGIGSQPLTEAPPTPDEQAAGPMTKLGAAMGAGATAGLGAILAGLQKAGEMLSGQGKKKDGQEGENQGEGSDQNTSGTAGNQGAGSGSGAAGSGAWGQMQQWLNSAQQTLAASMYSAQRRELERLLHLLQTNPDEGLRYALPQARDGQRKLGPGGSGSRLTERNIDFNLGRLLGTGSGVGSVWYGFDDIQRRLEEHYRRLAEREIQLGRHRRAAYIYAELLADLRSAAEALVAGKHFREAAVLYRDRLHAPRQAAECLEKGGLLVEAIEIYESLHDHLKVGDLYVQLERIPEARHAFKEAIAARTAAKDFLGAADVHVTRLNQSDAALQLLALAWPWSEQAALCLRRRFSLLGELGRIDEAQRLVTRLRDECTDRRVGVLAAELAMVVEKFPDRRVRETAADATRVVVGGRLPHVNDDESRALVAVLARLAPEDHLLQRDGVRWADRRAASQKKLDGTRSRIAPLRPASKRGRISHLGSFRLESDVSWRSFVGVDQGYWAAGYSTASGSRGDLVVIAGRWADVVLRPPGAEREEESRGATARDERRWSTDFAAALWPDYPQPRREYPVLLQPNFPDDRSTLLALLGGPAVPLKSLAFPSQTPPLQSISVGSSSTQPDGVLGAAVGDLRTLWMLRTHENTTLLNVYGEGGQLMRSRDLHWSSELYFQFPSHRFLRPIPMVVRAGAAITAAGRHLLRIGPILDREDLPAHTSALPSLIGDVVAPLSSATLSAAIALELGVAFLPNAERLDEWSEIGSEIAHPLLAYTRSGLLVVAGAAGLEVYEHLPERHHLTLLDGTHGEGSAPLGVTATDWLNRFAVASEDGVVRLYEAAERD